MLLLLTPPAAAQQPLPERAADALARAVRYFRSEISVQGSYLWSYSEDLKTRRGEGEATATQGWVQPPGTPAVGMAYLRAYEATGDRDYLQAAQETARALVRTQLLSGGWHYRIEFDPEVRRRWFYRVDPPSARRKQGERRVPWNLTVFDDNNTQSALQFLMRVDRTLDGKDPEIRQAVEYGLEKLIEAQHPNGAWSQAYDGNREAGPSAGGGIAADPSQRARYPEEWSRTHTGGDYWWYYTFNDGVMRNIILTLLEAHRAYGRREYLDAARKGGDFILLAQMPEPQPVWAQQYNRRMEPTWARRFEPPSVSAGESEGVVRTLMDLYRATGDEKYRKRIAPALAWFRRSRLPDGRWARFYELKTNRPLYFTKQYELVYTDNDLPTHYSFQGEYGIPALITDTERLLQEGPPRPRAQQNGPRANSGRGRSLEPRVREIITALDDRGRWVETGMIHSRTFVRNVETLADYLAAGRRQKPTRPVSGD